MYLIDDLIEICVPISICVVLPITIVWLNLRHKKHENDNRTGIILAAIEKNPDINLENLTSQMNPKTTTLKERLLKKLLWSAVISALGISSLGYALWMDFIGGMSSRLLKEFYMIGVAALFVGLAILLVFFISKRMMAKELEAEENKTDAHGQ